jgi:amino acid adenylation domain-containing protein/non-ribosomal peptide synthase protein (TIGR01720 family)
MGNNSKIKRVYSLSPMQEGMLFHSIMNSESDAYFEQTIYDIEGDIDIQIFEEIWNALIAKYDVLRTIFIYEEINKPKQVVLRERKIKIHFQDISAMPESAQKNYINEFKEKDKKKKFNLSKDMLIRIAALKTKASSYKVIWSFHHILMDGWSLGIIINEFFSIYRGIKENRPLQLEEECPYFDYIKWLEKQNQEEGYSYWRRYLETYENKALLPGKIIQSNAYQQKKLEVRLDKEITVKLTDVVHKYNVTINSFFQTIWGILLQRYNNTDDVVFGAVVSGRPAQIPGIESAVGLFINTIPVRIRSNEARNFVELVLKVQDNALLSEKYSYLSLAQIQSNSLLKLELIDHIMVFENYPQDEGNNNVAIREFQIKGMEAFEQTNYDFNILIVPGEELKINFQYNGTVYPEHLVTRVKDHFLNIIIQISDSPNINLEKIDILTEMEKHQILYDFNNTQVEYPKDKTIQELFEEQVSRTPDNVAIVYEDQKLTYKELNQRANQLARILRNKGAKSDSVIGILVKRSLEMIVGILGVLKAGAAYLPIDPEYPEDRINFMLEDSLSILLLTQHDLAAKLKNCKELIFLEPKELYQGDSSNLEKINNSTDLAYVIYTSGTTGKPKGVMIEHKSLINLCYWHNKNFMVEESDRATCYAGFGFDASVWETIPYLLVGASIYIIKEENRLDLEKLNLYFETNHITISFLPTQVCEQFMKIQNHSLRSLLTGGDRLRIFSKRNYQLFNNYGPTENTVVTTSVKIADSLNIPIGKPIFNTKIFILDKDKNLQPIGIPGELCISGESLARGYLNHPKLTAEKFIANPFIPGTKMYRTGDLARWLPDENIEFLGRMDHQVKIRGYRIELGEIENRLLEHERIKESVVIDRTDSQGNKYLCAYIVTVDELNITELKAYLLKNLPDYMVPSYFVKLDKIPLTPNGKIDRNAIPEPDGIIANGKEYVAPVNKMEETLVKIWQGVLGNEKIGIRDNFFELGGDSIKAIQILAGLNKYRLTMDFKDLFKNPAIEQLAKYIRYYENKISQDAVTGEIGLTPVQRWFYEQKISERHHFNQSIMLYRKEGFDEKIVQQVFNKILEHHDAFRMVYHTEGPSVIQYNRPMEGILYDLKVFDVTCEIDYIKKITEESDQLQKSIDLANGPLVKLGLFKTKDGDHLLIIIHHLVVDGVSWRILMEDLTIGYQCILQNEEIKLAPKTHSFQEWSNQLQQYSNSKEFLKEKQYWREIEERSTVVCLPKRTLGERISGKHSEQITRQSLSIKLSQAETEKLLKQVNIAFNTEINDILLAALGMAVRKSVGREKILIQMEGHGREDIISGMNISRTIGWFTSIYPVVLDMTEWRDISHFIQQTKQTLRRIPNHGIGYGILEYLTAPENKQEIEFKVKPEIRLNYLGQFDQGIQSHSIVPSKLPVNLPITPELNKLRLPLEISGIVMDNQLELIFNFNPDEYSETTIVDLLNNFQSVLLDILQNCTGNELITETASTNFEIGSKPTYKNVIEFVTNNLDENLDVPMMLLNSSQGVNLFAFPPVGSYGLAYWQLAQMLDNCSFYSFNFIEKESRIFDYLKLITNVQSEGPYILFGYSGGGNLAFEVAKELIRQGYKVSDLIFLDVPRMQGKTIFTEKDKQYIIEQSVEIFRLKSGFKGNLDHVAKKVESYIEYLSWVDNSGMVDINIHLIECTGEQSQEHLEGKDKWKEITSKEFRRHQGFGRHQEMLDIDFINGNVELIQQILTEGR